MAFASAAVEGRPDWRKQTTASVGTLRVNLCDTFEIITITLEKMEVWSVLPG